jgi:phosphatidylserine decarboxylase
MSQAFAAFQRLLPQHGLSRAVGRLAASEANWIRFGFIHGFARAYGISLTEAVHENLDDYRSFNDFFTRALKPGSRPLDEDPQAILCPADGTISQTGSIEEGQLLQAKGHSYSLRSLTEEATDEFNGGSFATVYLAPHNYHRVHLPASGTLTKTTAIPGELFSVNALTEAAIDNLFARNERLVCRFETPHGAMLVVLVGALIVASIETVWAGPASPYHQLERSGHNQPLGRGEEIGRFLLGSTVIVCFEPGRAEFSSEVRAGATVRMGQSLGRFAG